MPNSERRDSKLYLNLVDIQSYMTSKWMYVVRNFCFFPKIFVTKEDKYTKLIDYFNSKRKICILQKRLSSGQNPHIKDRFVSKLITISFQSEISV